MSPRQHAAATVAPPAEETAAEPIEVNPLDGILLATPVAQLFQAKLGRFVRHLDACTALDGGNDVCTCGARTAALELMRTEALAVRYGVTG
jgi:hypothetical protein